MNNPLICNHNSLSCSASRLGLLCFHTRPALLVSTSVSPLSVKRFRTATMGNSVSCFDPIREHPPYSWPKDHPRRAEEIARLRRERKNQKFAGSGGNARTVTKDADKAVHEAAAVPATAPEQRMANVTDEVKKDFEEMPVVDEIKPVEKVDDAVDQAERAKEIDMGQFVDKAPDALEGATDGISGAAVAAGAGATAVGGAFVAAAMHDDSGEEKELEDEVKVDDEKVDEVIESEERDLDNDAFVTPPIPTKEEDEEKEAEAEAEAKAEAEAEAEAEPEAEPEAEHEIVPEGETEHVVEKPEDVLVEDAMAEGVDAKPMNLDMLEESGVVASEDKAEGHTSLIDTRRAMFDKSEDTMPEPANLKRDVLDPVTNEYITLEEYRMRQRERAQGVVKERVEKFEEADDVMSKEMAEKAAIERARHQAMEKTDWKFKHSSTGSIERAGGIEKVEESLPEDLPKVEEPVQPLAFHEPVEDISEDSGVAADVCKTDPVASSPDAAKEMPVQYVGATVPIPSLPEAPKEMPVPEVVPSIPDLPEELPVPEAVTSVPDLPKELPVPETVSTSFPDFPEEIPVTEAVTGVPDFPEAMSVPKTVTSVPDLPEELPVPETATTSFPDFPAEMPVAEEVTSVPDFPEATQVPEAVTSVPFFPEEMPVPEEMTSIPDPPKEIPMFPSENVVEDVVEEGATALSNGM